MKIEKIQSLETGIEIPKSPLDLWRLMGKSKAERVRYPNSPDSMLAVYRDRLTYTFIFGREVASIHFNRIKREIFFKGHNVKNLDLNTNQIEALNDLKTILRQEKRGQELLLDYEATLGRLLADNYKEGVNR